MEEKKATFTITEAPLTEGQIGGKLEMTEEVVATIAGLAAHRVKGVASLGKSGFLRKSLGADRTRGIGVELGEKQAALDLEVVIEYGCNIHEVTAELRKLIAAEVFKMAGRQVVEVNIKVTGIKLPEEEKPEPTRRVK